MVLPVHEDVIKEHEYELSQIWPENIIHKVLKCRWRIRKAERHNEEFVMAIVCPKRRFGDILSSDSDLVVSRPQIQLGEDNRSPQLI
ncbi:hypothetical protein N665_0383s0041 [Sinapis alba]|nr:hypothetical protein N665_0383s0041 [Sinapis alba]